MSEVDEDATQPRRGRGRHAKRKPRRGRHAHESKEAWGALQPEQLRGQW